MQLEAQLVTNGSIVGIRLAIMIPEPKNWNQVPTIGYCFCRLIRMITQI
jgi:hypothetical protein